MGNKFNELASYFSPTECVLVVVNFQSDFRGNSSPKTGLV